MPALTAAQMAELSAAVTEILRTHSPVKTGNLKENAIQVHFDANSIVLEVDQDIAPYMPYTNEPWVADRWRGKRNPNQNWFDKAFFAILAYIAKEYGGYISRTDDASMTISGIEELAEAYNVDPLDILENSEYLADIQYSASDRDTGSGQYRMNFSSGVIPQIVRKRIR